MALEEANSKNTSLTAKLETAKKTSHDMTLERNFLKELSDGLLANQKEYQAKLQLMEKRAVVEAAVHKERVTDLQEQVRNVLRDFLFLRFFFFYVNYTPISI